MRIPFVIADVFTDRPLAGNQLMVVPDATALDGERMLELTREIGFSESTFVLDAKGDRYRMRIFSPGYEMPFAGHPTLGTAFVLATDGRIGAAATQEVPAGEFSVEVDLVAGTASVRQLAPEFGAEFADLDRVGAAIGLDPSELDESTLPRAVSTGLRHLIVHVRTPEAVARAEMNAPGVASLVGEHDCDGLYLFAVTDEGAKARLFAPGVVLAEDPATGSAAGPLGAYMAAHGLGKMPGSLVVRQGDEAGRPSSLFVTALPDGDSWSVSVGGSVRIVARGEFDLPD